MWSYLNNTNTDRYTWVDPANSLHKSRTDYILISRPFANSVRECTILNAPVPDHKCIKITIRINAKPRGPSYWKPNIDVLKENEYIEAIGNIFRETVNNYQSIICKRMVWDLFKIKVKEYTILYCKKRKHKKQYVMFEYENKLKEINLKLANLKFNENIELQMEREQVKIKLDAI